MDKLEQLGWTKIRNSRHWLTYTKSFYYTNMHRENKADECVIAINLYCEEYNLQCKYSPKVKLTIDEIKALSEVIDENKED